MRLFTLGLGAALGYLLGSAEGRQNLDKMSRNAQKLWNDPKTQAKVGKAQETAQAKLADVAQHDKVQNLAAKVGVADKLPTGSAPAVDSNNDHVKAANATGADPDIISDPSTPLADEGPAPAAAHH